MNDKTLQVRKSAMETAKGWANKGLLSTEQDRDGNLVAAAWWRVVDATDGGTKEQIEAETTKTRQSEAEFYAKWK